MHNVEKLMNAAKGNRHGQRNAPRRLQAWATSQQLAYVYFEDESGRRSAEIRHDICSDC
jgi:hypothetical protein